MKTSRINCKGPGYIILKNQFQCIWGSHPTFAAQSDLFMQNRHLIVLIALQLNCPDCRKGSNFRALCLGLEEIVLYSPLWWPFKHSRAYTIISVGHRMLDVSKHFRYCVRLHDILRSSQCWVPVQLKTI